MTRPSDQAALELREIFLRQAADDPAYAIAYALLEIAAAINGCAKQLGAIGMAADAIADGKEVRQGLKAVVRALDRLPAPSEG